MSSKLLINVNDATPTVVPDTSAPDTGMFSVSHTDGVDFNVGMILPIIGIAILVIAILATIITTTKKRKKINRFTTHTNKHLVAKLTTLSVVALLGVLGVMNADKLTSMVNATTDGSEDTLTITASDIKIDVDLNDKAVFATGESIVTVSSATEAGYTLMAYIDSNTTNLTNETNKSSTSTIAMLNTTDFKNPTALTSNTWGIATSKPTSQDSTVFTGLPTTLETAMTLKTTGEATTASDKSTFYYSTYITPDLDYGTYSGTTITYIAIANYAGPCNPNATTIQEAKCLQDFAGPNRDQIVDSMTPETQYTLKDMRDEKTYTIAKLRINVNRGINNNILYDVWMTQNLDLDLDSNTTYTNEDTDLGYNPDTRQYETATWTPERSTYTTDGTWGLYDASNNSYGGHIYPESYDPGDKYWNGNISNDSDWGPYLGTCNTINDPFIVNCTGTNPAPNYMSTTGMSQYHMGNYYNWTAAIASNNSSDYYDGEAVEQSICPAGWTLPTVYSGKGSFLALWSAYGYQNYEDGFNDATVLLSEPLYYSLSGFYGRVLSHVGGGGGYWSAVASRETAGYVSFFPNYGVANPSDGTERLVCMSVRCVARLDDATVSPK